PERDKVYRRGIVRLVSTIRGVHHGPRQQSPRLQSIQPDDSRFDCKQPIPVFRLQRAQGDTRQPPSATHRSLIAGDPKSGPACEASTVPTEEVSRTAFRFEPKLLSGSRLRSHWRARFAAGSLLESV